MSDIPYFKIEPAAIIRITGEDASDYLQSQFSNDLAQSQPGTVTYGLWLDRKGKVQADSFVFQLAEAEYLLMSYHCPADGIIAKLEENIIADEVEMEDVTAGAQLLRGVAMDPAQVPLDGLFMVSSLATGDGLRFQGRCSGRPWCEELWLKDAPANGVSPVDNDFLTFERISSGIPAVPQDIGPGDLPQEGGLEKVAVSFTKGCYLGQEVMARLHAMGRVQRALHVVSLPELPSENLPLGVKAPDGKAVGELRSVAERDGQVLGMAMLRKRGVVPDVPLCLPDGNQVTIVKALA